MDINNYVLHTLNTCRSLVSINNTLITLIPKIKNFLKVGDFRPISLFNITYKIIAKMLANRLKKIIHHIISPTQCAFIPHRLIIDNILITYETLHTLNSRSMGKQRFIALKLDMNKAYDLVE